MAKAAKTADAAPKEKEQSEDTFGAKKIYQEWDIKFVGGKVEKLKIRRDSVKITEEQAAILNDGVQKGNNNYGVMYFID